MDSIIDFLTSKTGIIAAISVAVGLIGGLIKIIQPLFARRKMKPELSMSKVKVEDPPPWSEAGKATFELMNASGGKAVMSDLFLIVSKHGKSKLPKMVEAAAPVPLFAYKVTLQPGVNEYDVRKREFDAPPPHSYKKEEVESFVVELRSTEAHWYEFYFLVKWYNSAKPNKLFELRSNDLKIEFKPKVEDLLD